MLDFKTKLKTLSYSFLDPVSFNVPRSVLENTGSGPNNLNIASRSGPYSTSVMVSVLTYSSRPGTNFELCFCSGLGPDSDSESSADYVAGSGFAHVKDRF